MKPPRPFTASIEMLPRQFKTMERLPFPSGTRVYLTDIGTPDTETEMLAAAVGLAALGYRSCSAHRCASDCFQGGA